MDKFWEFMFDPESQLLHRIRLLAITVALLSLAVNEWDWFFAFSVSFLSTEEIYYWQYQRAKKKDRGEKNNGQVL
ncbi:hypothetical protein LMC02_09755 [Limosilactobacillus reuteri]|uniref:hypothetical protein n=1 Tax=Limosilactobacillus reuteri TaxID=1598 RepID=UPI001E3536BE|nr:hypothetical protein [Limosilactobacillus reuteri]MCC4500271.1 hypothetical protein [Limosilactobacillus reuteri]MCC4500596.1 hypothetical protein [Limosilactobacillus reuteri]